MPVGPALVANETAGLRPADGGENLRIAGVVIRQAQVAEHRELVGRVPINLGVGGEAVERHVRRAEEVVAGHRRAGVHNAGRGQRQHRQDFGGHRADAVGANLVQRAVAGYLRPPIAFGISRRRVVYNIRIGLGQV